jgi:predicted Kef-type K+ transport protein
VALATGIGQIVFTSVIGLLLALALGMNLVTSAYVAVALTFSSTIIIVKLLSDKRESDSLDRHDHHGCDGYRKRTGFLCGLTVAQISEFSIVFTALGVSRRHIGAEALGLVTLVGLITIAL